LNERIEKVTVNLALLVALPWAVVTATLPVLAPSGTVTSSFGRGRSR
jgi:hypothetical protein